MSLQLVYNQGKHRVVGTSKFSFRLVVKTCNNAIIHVLYIVVLRIHERAPTPFFWPNFLYRVKVYSNERPPWSELHVEFEKHGLERYAYLR